MHMKKILVVDDETNIRNLIKNILGNEYQISTATNGIEALEVLKNEEFDLIILDINMPQMDGVEFMKQLRKQNISTPVIVASAFSDPEKLIKVFKLGASDFVIKPFSSDQILETVHKTFETEQKKEKDISELIKKSKQFINIGNLTKAKENILELLKILPSSPIPHFLYGIVLEKEHKLEEAKKHFQASLIFDPSYEPARKKLKNIGG